MDVFNNEAGGTRQSRPVYRDELRELVDQVKRIADALEKRAPVQLGEMPRGPFGSYPSVPTTTKYNTGDDL